ncbi:Peptidoglycan/LPS O-acetylase OafA/YrhL, contains acyltransferase and SGNH-hydrolase domains [Micromonospora pattaloongensis]|uniref:Peptidoglycan/LPS O-acetylase OafA/YrhL, contains acyltransferase and SGNH-hydrolase domains n=1 Tax=Micromonospora pattaloongensis TaxID=405436 RepID=A0A1H3JBP6_9ACTN|nr:acyltransferase [Micromonospora pattaloongensis]SDY37356.1 Peptidoglycan/LPS O-acetylase OafA/YrhL, contains acyltransferase and SGNH-hydrolase domains [Micromonospora pattaloongensis]
MRRGRRRVPRYGRKGILSEPQPAARRLPSLTGLRFAAALLVFGVHAYSMIPLADPTQHRIAQVLLDAGDLGVSFFFVLSGFVLTWSARPGLSTLRFWRGRIARVYPAHLAALGFALAGLALTDRIPPILTDLLIRTGLLVQAWDTRDVVYLGLNPVTWSLSCEAAFYLCFPLLYAGLRRLGTGSLRVLTVALVAGVWLMPTIAELAVAPEHRRWFVYVFPLTRMLEFALGIVLARLVATGAWRGPALGLAMLIFAGNYLIVDWLPAETRDTAGTIVATALLIPAAALADLRGSRSVWRGRATQHLGEVSYAFFLIHLVVIVTAMELIGRERTWSLPAALALTAALLLISYALAVPLHRWVELPAMRLLAGRRPAPALPRQAGAPRVEEIPIGARR